MNHENGWIKYLTLIIFSFLLGSLEYSVAFYLRSSLGINGGLLPLKNISVDYSYSLLSVEYFRSWIMLLMMAAVAFLYSERHFYRLLAFLNIWGIWQISSLFGLRFLTGWPSSILEYDVIFFAPTMGVAPLIAPVIIAFSLITVSSFLLFLGRNRGLRSPELVAWSFGLIGTIVVVVAFVENSSYYIAGGAPPRFSWVTFWIGYGLLLVGGMSYLLQVLRQARMRFF